MTRRAAGVGRYASPAALSAPVGLLYLPIGLVAVWSDRVRIGGELVPWVVAAIAGQLALSGTLALASRVPRRHGAAGPVRALVAYPLAGVARGVTIAITLVSLGVADPATTDWVYRTVGGAFFSAAVLVAAGWVVVAYADHRALVGALAAQRDALQRARADLDRDVAVADAALAREVHAVLEPRIDTLDARLSQVAAGGSGSEAATAFRAFVEDEVRPLGRRLGSPGTPDPIPAGPLPPAPAARGPLPIPSRMRLGAGMEPWLVVVIFGGAILPTAMRALGPGSGAVFATAVVVSAAIYFGLARRVLGDVRLPTLAALVCGGLIHGAFVLVASALFIPLGLPRPGGLVPPAFVVAAFVGVALMLAAVVGALRTATADELRATVGVLEAALAELSVRAALARMRLACVVHGDVQGALQAAIFLLTRPDGADAAALDAVRTRIRAALAKLQAAPEPGAALPDALAELAELWEGTCTIRPARGEVDAPDVPEPTRTAAVTVLREAIGNAIRHGGARTVSVGWQPSDRVLVLTVEDDGDGWSDVADAGLGTVLYDELAPGWRAEQAAVGTRLVAPIPLPASER